MDPADLTIHARCLGREFDEADPATWPDPPGSEPDLLVAAGRRDPHDEQGGVAATPNPDHAHTASTPVGEGSPRDRRCVCGHGPLQHVALDTREPKGKCHGFVPDRHGGLSARCGCERFMRATTAAPSTYGSYGGSE